MRPDPCGKEPTARECKKKKKKTKPKHGKDSTGPPAADSGALAELARALPGLDLVKDE